MPFKIIRSDITKIECDAIVNTANCEVLVGAGCDTAIYEAAGYEELLAYRAEHIGYKEEGESFITPAFKLPARYIIHTVSPLYRGGNYGEEEKLRSCYRNSLALASENKVRTIAFPLISTGEFGYPKEQGLRIALDEINDFLFSHEMLIYLVVFDRISTQYAGKLYDKLEQYIDDTYVNERLLEEDCYDIFEDASFDAFDEGTCVGGAFEVPSEPLMQRPRAQAQYSKIACLRDSEFDLEESENFYSDMQSKLEERISHLKDSFSDYLLFLIAQKNMTNAEVYTRALVDKKLFSKINTNPDYHPKKDTVLCLCVGAKLNLDEAKDLLARAGYALSPCELRDVIFSYFIENEIYDMIELDIQLEEHGLKCFIS